MQSERELTIAPAANAEVERPSCRSRFKTKRSWQLAILEQMGLPKKERSKDDRPVKAAELKSLFHAIDSRAREDSWYMLPIEDELDDDGNVVRRGLASEAQLSLRQCKRCLEVAQAKGWLEKRVQPLKSGADRCWWRIVFQELARTTTLPLWADAPGPECPPAVNQVPGSMPPSARIDATKCPDRCHQVPNSTGPSAHAGTPQETSEAPKNDPTTTTTAPVAVVVGNCVSDEAEGIRALATELSRVFPAVGPERKLALQFAALSFRGRIGDRTWNEALGSFRLALKRGTPIDDPGRYLRAIIRRCEFPLLDEHGGRQAVDSLLESTEFPREFLPVPPHYQPPCLSGDRSGRW